MKPNKPEISGNDIADEIEAGLGRHAVKPIEHAFLSSILESPDDDAPRLIYADWLEENGQAKRAEFIRVQCELAKLPECEFVAAPLLGICLEKPCDQTSRPVVISCRSCNLRRRERELFFSDPFSFQPIPGDMQMYESLDPPSVTMHGIRYTFRRGFVEEITISLAEWLHIGPALVRVAPLRVVRLSDYKPRRDGNAWFYPNNLLELLPETASFCPGIQWRHVTEADALVFMSHFCLEYAHGQNTKTVQT